MAWWMLALGVLVYLIIGFLIWGAYAVLAQMVGSEMVKKSEKYYLLIWLLWPFCLIGVAAYILFFILKRFFQKGRK